VYHLDTLYDDRTGIFLTLTGSINIPNGPSRNYDDINLVGKKGIRVFKKEFIAFNEATVFLHHDFDIRHKQYVLEVYSSFEKLNKRWAELRGSHNE
jgi:hypothetical protein